MHLSAVISAAFIQVGVYDGVIKPRKPHEEVSSPGIYVWVGTDNGIQDFFSLELCL